MINRELKSMSLDELWSLRESVNSELGRKIAAEKARLDHRLRQLCLNENIGAVRRVYPPVNPKYANPARPSETWSGRGRQPRWLAAQLRSGRKLDDFRIQPN
jgi:DNA-binding protein H-NS